MPIISGFGPIQHQPIFWQMSIAKGSKQTMGIKAIIKWRVRFLGLGNVLITY